VLTIQFPFHDQIAASLFLIASLTDVLDGNLARWRGQVTELGKFLDPLADKVFVLSVLIVLVQEGLLAAWVVVIIFSRELLITVLRSLRMEQGVVAATPFGKTKTVLQVLAVLMLILQRSYPELALPARVGVGAALVFTVISGVDYLWRFRRVWWGQPKRLAGEKAEVLDELGQEDVRLVGDIAERLEAGGLSLVVAESCTGGLLAGALTNQAGSSAWFKGGVVAYADSVKRDQLGVSSELLERFGAVSAEVAKAMAEGARKALSADLGVSITGIAGPGSDGTAKPVGLTHIWLEGMGRSEGRCLVFEGDRRGNRRQAVLAALSLVRECLPVNAAGQTNFRL
jgi:CDP-diacylglycerol--glycerol-3-phosphate 3-phosphatidyltransferase